jgi:hypothetical protein
LFIINSYCCFDFSNSYLKVADWGYSKSNYANCIIDNIISISSFNNNQYLDQLKIIIMETRDIAAILRSMNAEKYKLIIERADDYQYHDFKSEFAAPKMQLAADLAEFPELNFLRDQVIKGDYDE